MSDLAFHTGIPDRQLYACRALKKAQRLGMSACVLVETEGDLRSFDERLWAFDNTSFIPHGPPGNMQDLMQRFPKIIDVVASAGAELEEGRSRYRSYKKQGLQPKVVNPKN